MSADALKKHFNKEGRKGLVKTFVNSGKAIKTLWQTKGKDKQAWKDLGKGVATIGGVALTVTAVAGFATHASANEVPTDNISNQNENDVNHDTETNSYVATERLGLDTALETDLNGNPLDPTVMQNIINAANTELQQMDQMVANGEATVEYGQQQGVTTAYYQLENGSVRVSNDPLSLNVRSMVFIVWFVSLSITSIVR